MLDCGVGFDTGARHFAENHFAEKTFRRNDTMPKNFSQVRHFAESFKWLTMSHACLFIYEVKCAHANYPIN